MPAMWGGIAAGVGALASGALGYMGQQSANEANREMSDEQRQFAIGQSQADKQWQMMMFAQNYQNQLMARKTQYQTAVQDMKEAGLNPMLAYQQGGAGNVAGGSGGSSQSMNYTPAQAGNKFAAAAHSAQQLGSQVQAYALSRQSDAQARRTDELVPYEKEVLRTEAVKNQSSAGRDVMDTKKIEQEIDYLVKTMEDRVKKLGYESISAFWESVTKQAEAGIRKMEDIHAAKYFAERANELTAQAKIRELAIPEALAQAKYWQSDAGRHQPYIQTPSRIVGSAAEAALSGVDSAIEGAKGTFRGLKERVVPSSRYKGTMYER